MFLLLNNVTEIMERKKTLCHSKSKLEKKQNKNMCNKNYWQFDLGVCHTFSQFRLLATTWYFLHPTSTVSFSAQLWAQNFSCLIWASRRHLRLPISAKWLLLTQCAFCPLKMSLSFSVGSSRLREHQTWGPSVRSGKKVKHGQVSV